jgi:hypothetical protein
VRLILAVLALLASGPGEKTPVLLELFTSTGCSSCPSADKLLAEIDSQQPVPNARLIVLSENVDYWNTPAWSDPFSSAASSTRQEIYDTHFGIEPYTPQLVIDGAAPVSGNDRAKAVKAINASLSPQKIPMHVTAMRVGGKAQLEIVSGANSSGKNADVFLVLAHDRATSHVRGGENAGRELTEVAVAYAFQEAGKMKSGMNFQKSLVIALPPHSTGGDSRAIVFARRSDTLRVIGVDQIVF